MFRSTFYRIVFSIILFGLLGTDGRALITGGTTQFVPDMDWPAGSEELANLPARFSYWEGPPFGGGNYHFQYTGDTEEFQSTLDTFAAIEAPRLELLVYDGGTESPFTDHPVHWEFEIWSADRFFSLNHSGPSLSMSDSPWFGRPLPPPRLSLFLDEGNPVDWSAVVVPDNVTLLDRRVATSPWAESKGGVVQATNFDMTTKQAIPGAILEVGHDEGRNFKCDASTPADASGIAVLCDLGANHYVVQAHCDGYATRQAGYYSNYGRTLGVFDPVYLSPASSVRGRVIDASSEPIVHATVGVRDLVGLDGKGYIQNLYNERTKAQTDKHGWFTLEALPMGRICLSVRKKGYHCYSADAFPVPGDDVTLVMTRSGMIRGRVSGVEKLPRGQKVHVNIEPAGDPIGRWGGGKLCEPDGSFTFQGVPADTYTLTPTIAGPLQGGDYRINQPARRVTLKPGQIFSEVNLELKLQPSSW